MAEYAPLILGNLGPEEIEDSDTLSGIRLSGNMVMTGGATITGLPSIPSGDTEPTSKSYVDAQVNGLPPKTAVRLKTVAALPAYTAAGSGVGKTLTGDVEGRLQLDGVDVTTGDRVLVDSEAASHVDHGIYDVTEQGAPTTTQWVLTRATDFDENDEVEGGDRVWVNEGSTRADTAWAVSTNDDITVDTTAIAFTQYGGQGHYTGGDGISISVGGEVAVDLSGTPGLEFSVNQLQVLVDPSGALLRQAAGLHVNTDDSTIQINGSNQLEVIGSDRAKRLEEELTCDEDLANGDAVEWSSTTANRIRECQASVAARLDCFGVLEEASGITSGNPGTVVRRGIATGVISGATQGDRFYVGDSGGLVNGRGNVSDGNHLILVGTAVNATDLEVNPYYAGKKAASPPT